MIGTNAIVGLAIAVVVAAYMLPTAITAWFAANTTTWDTGSSSMWSVVPIVILAAIVIGFVGRK